MELLAKTEESSWYANYLVTDFFVDILPIATKKNGRRQNLYLRTSQVNYWCCNYSVLAMKIYGLEEVHKLIGFTRTLRHYRECTNET